MRVERLALLFILLSVCDATFTVCFIIGGHGTEANPLLQSLMENLYALPLIKFTAALTIAWIAIRADRKGYSWGRYGLIICSLFYGGVLLWNYKELLFG
ncbi:hypothetical protein DRP05_13145 [Archaeoglobales archaeon]|nr:MAG: hypothetical protein DRP05_13145 [Archaeoglobales archaeon]